MLKTIHYYLITVRFQNFTGDYSCIKYNMSI